MKKIFIITLLVSLISFPNWSETIEDLVEREGLYYKKFTDTPFTGEISGIQNGKFIKGKRVGRWILYYEKGQLESKFNIKSEKIEGLWQSYHTNGKLNKKGNHHLSQPNFSLSQDQITHMQLSLKNLFKALGIYNKIYDKALI